MPPFPGVLGGAAGGLAGAFLAQTLTALCNRHEGAEDWLKGPYGPPFFNIALFMGVFYGCIALGLAMAAAKRRSLPVGLGLTGPFLGIALPLFVLTRTATWGALPDAPPTSAWVYAVTIIYTVAVWSTVFALGWTLSDGSPWKGGVGSVLGAALGYGALVLVVRLSSGIGSGVYSPLGFLPQPTVLLDGILGGAGMGLGISLGGRRNDEKRNDS